MKTKVVINKGRGANRFRGRFTTGGYPANRGLNYGLSGAEFPHTR